MMTTAKTLRDLLFTAAMTALLDELADPLLRAAMMIVRSRLDELEARR